MNIQTDYPEIQIAAGDVKLPGHLVIVENTKGIIVFSHGSGSSRFSPRNNLVAQFLQRRGFSTLLFDLLTKEEDKDYEKRFDISLLKDRLVGVTKWLQQNPETSNMPIAYFGASTGAASALSAAALLGSDIKAVVSRGGRPDMVLADLEKVEAATMLIVGGLDKAVIEFNDQAYQKLGGVRNMTIVPDASHLFIEEGKLLDVAELAVEWFNKYLI